MSDEGGEPADAGPEAPKPELLPIAGRLLKIRKAMNFSQAEFASRLNVPLRTYRRWESGIRDISTAATQTLVGLGWDASWLMTGQGGERLPATGAEAAKFLRTAQFAGDEPRREAELLMHYRRSPELQKHILEETAAAFAKLPSQSQS